MSHRQTVTIFAASRLPYDGSLALVAQALGTRLAQAGFDVNYGGGTGGLMGAAAEAAAAAGGGVNAFVLKRYADETQVAGARIINVETEQERFAAMMTEGKPVAMIVLPSGPGGLREALQALEAAVYDQGPPVILIRSGPYLDGIKNYFDHAVAQGMIKAEHRDKLKLMTAIEAVDYLAAPAVSPLLPPAPPVTGA